VGGEWPTGPVPDPWAGLEWSDVPRGSGERLPVSEPEWAAYVAGHPDRWLLEAPVDPPIPSGAAVGRAWVAAAAEGLRVDPGLDLLAAVVDLLPEDRAAVLSDDELVRLVTAAHRLVGWLTTVRADATRAVADRWSSPFSGTVPGVCGQGSAGAAVAAGGEGGPASLAARHRWG